MEEHPGVVLPMIRRSEEHTSELQSPCNLVCRLLLEKKNDDKPPQPRRRRFRVGGVGGGRARAAEQGRRTAAQQYLAQHRRQSAARYPLSFFNDTATTEIYTLSLHDPLPI